MPFGGISTDITERKRAEMAERFLAEASRRLAADLGYEATLDAIAGVAVPELAEGAALYVLDDAGVRSSRAGRGGGLPGQGRGACASSPRLRGRRRVLWARPGIPTAMSSARLVPSSAA